MSSEIEIRRGADGDLGAISDIYNRYIRETPITFDIDPWSDEKRLDWFVQFSDTGRHQLYVADDGGKILGFAYSAQFRMKAAYDTSVEVTVYLHQDCTRRGTGSKLYETLFEALAKEDIHRALAGITLPNDASSALHRKFGFTSVGIFHEVGRKFGKFWDVEWFEKKVD